MNIFVYSDESGVFDKVHYRYFVFGGIICIDSTGKELWSRKYSAAEKSINRDGKYGSHELKGSRVSAKDKNKLFRSLNQCYKFAVVIDQSALLDEIYLAKKDKQRYLDYAYKTVVEEAFFDLEARGIIDLKEVDRVYFNVDEHSTATNGIYELQAILEQELVLGTFNYDYSRYYAPSLPNCREISVTFCDSETKLLIRPADIIANKIFYCAENDKMEGLAETPNLFLLHLPFSNEKTEPDPAAEDTQPTE